MHLGDLIIKEYICLIFFLKSSQKVLKEDLGPDWRSKMKEFDGKPFAAASIGQVHSAVTLDDRHIALKIQVCQTCFLTLGDSFIFKKKKFCGKNFHTGVHRNSRRFIS